MSRRLPVALALLAALGLPVSAMGQTANPAAADPVCVDPPMIAAGQIEEFRMMAMATALRCEITGVHVRAGYDAMMANHRAAFGRAETTLARLFAGGSARQGNEAFGSYTTHLANLYGMGDNTRATCEALDQVLRSLAATPAGTPAASAMLGRVAATMVPHPDVARLICAPRLPRAR